MEKTPLYEGPRPDDPDAYVIRTAGVFVVRDQSCRLRSISFLEPFKGRLRVFDSESASGILVLDLDELPNAPHYLTAPACLSNGLTVEVDQDCYLIVRSSI